MPVDVAAVRASGAYAARLPLSQMSADLDQIERAIQSWLTHRKQMNRYAFLLLPLAVLLLILGAVTGFRVLIGLAVPMFFAAVLLFIYSALYARNCCKRVHRLRLVRDLVAMVADDAGQDAPISVDFAFNERKVLLATAPWPARRKGEQKFFKDTWATFEAELLDGAAISQEIADLIRERTYVNPRGKGKRKRRDRHMVSTRIVYPAETYGDASKCPAKLIEGIRVPPLARLRGCKVSDRDIKLKAQVDRLDRVKDTCVMLALGGYRILNYARAVRRPAEGQAS